MQIIGTGSGSASVSFQKLHIKLAKGDFYQVLSQFGDHVGSKQDFGDSRQNAKNSNDQNKLLHLQENNELPQLNDEGDSQNPFVSDSYSNILQLIHQFLEAENTNSFEIHAEAGQNSNVTAKAGNIPDEKSAMTDCIPRLLSGQPNNHLNKDLLSLFQIDNTNLDSNTTAKTSKGFLQTVMNQMEKIGHDGYPGSGPIDFVALLSQAVRQNSRDSTIEMQPSPLKENSSNHQVKDRNKLLLSLQAENEILPQEENSTNSSSVQAPVQSLHSSNETKLIALLSALQVGNEILPQEENSTNTTSVQAPVQSLHSSNETKLIALLSALQVGNEILPQSETRTNIDIKKVIQNVFGINGQKESGTSVIAGDHLSDKLTAKIQDEIAEKDRPRTKTMQEKANGHASQSLIQQNENQNLPHGAPLNEWFSSLQTGSVILPQEETSLKTDILSQAIENVVGKSEQIPSSVQVELGDYLNEKAVKANPMGWAEREGLYPLLSDKNGLTSQPHSQPNENNFSLKAVPSDDLFISNNRIGDMQILEGANKGNSNVQGNAQFSNILVSQKYLVNRFSQTVKEMNSNSKPDMDVKTSNLNPSYSDRKLTSSVFVQPMSKIEQFVLMTQGTQKAPVTVENMIQQFESILGKSQFSKTGGTQKLLIQLHPENLGSLRIELIQKDQTTIARILTTTDAAKEALESHLHSLKDAFTAQNISINKVEVEIKGSPSQQEPFPNNEQQQQRNNHSNQQKQNKNDNEEETESTFTLSLDAVLLNKKV